MSDQFRCEVCGKFLSYENAVVNFIEPLNEFGPELTEVLCHKCNGSQTENAS